MAGERFAKPPLSGSIPPVDSRRIKMKNPWIQAHESCCKFCGKKIKVYYDDIKLGLPACEECIKNKAWKTAP